MRGNELQRKKKQPELHPELWGAHYTAKEIEMLKIVAKQYGLDPLAREVIIIKGNIYVTAAGLQKLALRDPDYDGCEIELVHTDWENNFFVVKARVWKKGCSRPFEDYGDADPSTSGLRGHALFRHAITRARARAMRSAFAIPFCTLEELDDDFRLAVVKEGMTNKAFKDLPANDDGAATPLPKIERKKQSKKYGKNPTERGVKTAEEIVKKEEKKKTNQINIEEPEGDKLAKQILERMLNATTLEELKSEWEHFNNLRYLLPNQWIERIIEAKEDKKSELRK